MSLEKMLAQLQHNARLVKGRISRSIQRYILGNPNAQDYHELYQHRWITPKASAYNSRFQGLGVKANQQINAGEIVAILGGVIVDDSQILEYRKRLGHRGIQIRDDKWIVPTSIAELEQTGVFNHSCDPNIGYIDSITLAAIRDIKVGEELAFDYAFGETFFDSFHCNCKSSDCRETIKPDDWKIPSIQEKYGKYFSPYLKEKLRQKI